MAEHTQDEVETVFSGKDLLTATVGRIIGAGQRLNSTFDRASEMLGGFASVAAVVGGGFSLERAIESTTEYMRSIDRVSTLTGLSTQHTDALLEAMEGVNIEGESAERILLGMSRRTENMEMHMNAVGEATGTTGQLLRRMGVDVRHGIVRTFESMSSAVQKNKLQVSDLGLAFGIPRNQTIALYKLLQQGPEHIKEAIKEAEKFGVTIGDLSAYRRIDDAQSAIKSAWKRISIIVGSELLPVIADLLKGGADKLKGWVEHAREFGRTLGSWLRDHYQMVLKIGKVMLANYALQKATGEGFGGHGARIIRFVAGSAAAPPVAAGPARAGVMGLWDALLARMGIIKWVIGGLGRLTLIGGAITLIYTAFVAIKDNVLGVREYLSDLWKRISLRFEGIKIAMEPLFKLFGTDGVIGHFFANVLVKVIKGLGKAVETILEMLHIWINFFVILRERGIAALRDPMVTLAAAMHRTAAQMRLAELQRQNRERAEAVKREVPKQRERQPYYDFRGSRFDIKQAFADVDPDRIAVAFANSLGAMGERRVQSSFAPLWAV